MALNTNPKKTIEQVVTGIVAAGTNQATATKLWGGYSFQEILTVPAGTGVMLPPNVIPGRVIIANADTNDLSVYPQVGCTIDNGSVNAAATVKAGKSSTFEVSSATNHYTVGATAAAGTGTVNSGTAGQVAVYASNGTAVSGQNGAPPVISIITPSISANQNNWNPTGWLTAAVATATLIRTTQTASTVNITGLVAPSSGVIDGFVVTIENAPASVGPIRFKANSGSSSAANQFGFTSDVFIMPGESVQIQYNLTATTWHELAPHKSQKTEFYGSAKDGTGPTTSANFSRSMYFDDWTIPASQVFGTGCNDIYVNGTLDISNASTGSIVCNGVVGGTTASSVGGAAPSLPMSTVFSLPLADSGKIGGAGSINNGSAGTTNTLRTVYNALAAGNSGAGGAGGTGSGGGAVGITTPGQAPLPYEFRPPFAISTSAGAATLAGSQGGPSGGGGGGDTVTAGGGGGASGGGGGFIRIYARNIYRGTNSNAGIIQAIGGTGGAGGPGGTTGSSNTGGGGGGAGSSGGSVLIYYGFLSGTQIANAIDVTGGSGGAGGAKQGTGAVGNGAYAGPGGYVMQMNLATGVAVDFNGAARVTNSGQTGGVATSSKTAL